ncbi:MAG: hypothetical protein ACLP9S_02530 [Syntrophales bacterium]
MPGLRHPRSGDREDGNGPFEHSMGKSFLCGPAAEFVDDICQIAGGNYSVSRQIPTHINR